MPWDKKFDVETARHRAMATFWSNGYEATSMQDLLDAMGIQRGSFYDTFGSKREILLESLRRYDEARNRAFAELTRRHAPRERIRALLQKIIDDSGDASRPRGCLLVNSASELAPRDAEVAAIVGGAFEQTAAFFEAAIREGQAGGTIPRRVDAAPVARSLLTVLLGLQVLIRSGAPRESLEPIVAQADTLVPKVRRKGGSPHA